jgi:hypothetical protein
VFAPQTATARTARLEALSGVLERLESVDSATPKDERPGEGLWRAAELEKLLELVRGACSSGPAACRDGLEPIAAAKLPADEVWPLYVLFLQDLRPRAEEGAVVLGRDLLLRDQATVRDRTFRVAVGIGAAVRGSSDEEGRRASVLPIHPGVGEPVLFIVEQVAACDRVVAEVKGPPDSSGRLDLIFHADCPEPTPAPQDTPPTPRAARVVWAFDAGPLPESGLRLWIDGAEAPLLTVATPSTTKQEQPE